MNSFLKLVNYLSSPTVGSYALRILLILTSAWLSHRFLGWLSARLIRPWMARRHGYGKQRALTVLSLVTNVLTLAIYLVAIIAILAIFIKKTEYILTAFGLLGAGLSFAARSFISDCISGLAIIFEDQFSVGEKVELAGVQGVVEGVSLRTTRIRGNSGELFVVPNGEIRLVRNFSRGSFSIATVKVSVASSDLASAIVALDEVAEMAYHSLPELIERPEIISESGRMASETELSLIAKAKFGSGARTRKKLLEMIHSELERRGIKTGE